MSDAASNPAPAPDRARLNFLVEAVARQDRDAFAELFQFYAPRVKAYLLRLNASDALAEELAQEVMLTVWRKAGQFDPAQASASTWIFRIARNRRIDAVRRADKPDLDGEDPLLAPSHPESPDAAVISSQSSSRVAQAMAGLPEEQIALLRLAFFEGLSHRDIAEREGVPLGTVKSRLRLAFDKMRNILQSSEL